ncbi:hypothetical protein [Streptacidiphilus sp. EB103A]|uniref:hypothetical protein n=1 Tax=Streptacidiphilus sp. EB103A TaxID=3156275 RepID=UPI003518BEF9
MPATTRGDKERETRITTITYAGADIPACPAGTDHWTAGDIRLHLRRDLNWSAARGESTATGPTAQNAVNALAYTEARERRAAALASRSTRGQNFAREMRSYLRIGTRSRRFQTGRWILDGHRDVLTLIAEAHTRSGSTERRREDLFRSAFAAMCAWHKHIDGYRAHPALVLRINSMTPHQFCGLLGEMIDAGVSNNWEGEEFFAAMNRRAASDRPAAGASTGQQ